MGITGQLKSIQINKNRFLCWKTSRLRNEKRLPQAALHRPLQTDKPASSLVKVRKHYEEDGGTFHLHARDFSAGMVSYFGHKTKEFIPIHIGRSQEIRWLYLLASLTLGTSSAITEPGFLSIGTITWTGTWSQSTKFKINMLEPTIPTLLHRNTLTKSKSDRCQCEAVLSMHTYAYQLPGGSATRPTGRTMYSKIRKICWVASQSRRVTPRFHMFHAKIC